jgi:hypothetical protein
MSENVDCSLESEQDTLRRRGVREEKFPPRMGRLGRRLDDLERRIMVWRTLSSERKFTTRMG